MMGAHNSADDARRARGFRAAEPGILAVDIVDDLADRADGSGAAAALVYERAGGEGAGLGVQLAR